MSEWISVKDKKPKEDCMGWVCNSRRGVHCFLALYQKRWDVWVQYDPKIYHLPALDVTHYIELPSYGPLES